MIKLSQRDARKLEKALETFTESGFPKAVEDTLNRAAFDTRRRSLRAVGEQMITRNAWTRKSIQVERVTPAPVDQMRSEVGSVAPYMATQEFGGTKTRSGSEGVPIATSWSAGEALGARPRKRLPRRPNQMTQIQLRGNAVRARNRKQRNAIVVRQAARKRQRFVFLDLGRRKGIFKVIGTRERPEVRMVHDMSRASVIIPKNPWLRPAFEAVAQELPAQYVRSLRFQARRHQLFR